MHAHVFGLICHPVCTHLHFTTRYARQQRLSALSACQHPAPTSQLPTHVVSLVCCPSALKGGHMYHNVSAALVLLMAILICPPCCALLPWGKRGWRCELLFALLWESRSVLFRFCFGNQTQRLCSPGVHNDMIHQSSPALPTKACARPHSGRRTWVPRLAPNARTAPMINDLLVARPPGRWS